MAVGCVSFLVSVLTHTRVTRAHVWPTHIATYSSPPPSTPARARAPPRRAGWGRDGARI